MVKGNGPLPLLACLQYPVSRDVTEGPSGGGTDLFRTLRLKLCPRRDDRRATASDMMEPAVADHAPGQP
jgi:hypothetical protein